MLGSWLESVSIVVIGFDLFYYSLKIWYGVNVFLIMSLIVMSLGILIYFLFCCWIDVGEEGFCVMWVINFGVMFECGLNLFIKCLL